ncbi:DUF3079 domain-containing protein [Stenotrophomonas sp. DR822]|uniref:DUF3079 domain-containing protein n=1 Tax=Stenotrophomonas sp. DR822 TaxID=2871174 RepID=UPI0021BC2502|nr:DUF3079 domain-containing protein [Stenotrophomonas sp. DR822]
MARRYRYCAADALACGNGSGRTQHPIETQGEDWYTARESSRIRTGHRRTSAERQLSARA